MKLKWNWFYLFIIVYTVYLFTSIDAGYMDADGASHAMTGVFYEQLFKDFSVHPTLNLSAVYEYAKSFYVHYPKFSFIYGPFYPVLMGIILLVAPASIFLFKSVIVIFSVLSVILVYYGFKNWFDERIALLTVLLTATSNLFVSTSLRVLLDIPCFFFFSAAFYFYTKGYSTKSWKHFLMFGLFAGFSILSKEIGLIYVASLILLSLISIRRIKIKNFVIALAALALIVSPYVGLLYFTQGGLDALLHYPQRQAWYSVSNNDPQWTEPAGWIFYLGVLNENFSFLFMAVFLVSFGYLALKNGEHHKNLFLLFIFMYLAVTMLNDKNPKQMLLGTGIITCMVAVFFDELLRVYKHNSRRQFILIFLLVLLLVIQVPLGFTAVRTPFNALAQDLRTLCPDGCTVLVASEVGRVYSSLLMYETLINDDSVSMRFLRPTAFTGSSAQAVINDEKVNYVVVIGEPSFLKDNDETSSYYNNIEYIINKYDLLGFYPSDIVGRVFLYSTGINESKQPPLCTSAQALGMNFSTNYMRPDDALKA